MERLQRAQFIAAGATTASVVGFLLMQASKNEIGGLFLAVGVLAGIVSYFFGGFGKACSISLKIAKFGWIITPFPIDLFTLLISFMVSIYVFLFLPIIPVRMAYKENM